MNVKLLIEHYLVFLSLKEDCRGSSESTLVKMSNCWKSHDRAEFIVILKRTATNKRMAIISFMHAGSCYITSYDN